MGKEMKSLDEIEILRARQTLSSLMGHILCGLLAGEGSANVEDAAFADIVAGDIDKAYAYALAAFDRIEKTNFKVHRSDEEGSDFVADDLDEDA